MSQDEATLISEEIKPVALAIIELYLSECISQSFSQSVENSAKEEILKFYINFLVGCRADLNTLLS